MLGLLGFLFDGNSCYRDIVVKYMELTHTYHNIYPIEEMVKLFRIALTLIIQ